MPEMETKNFGKISYEAESELEYPCGLPGFDRRKRFVAVRCVESDPLVYLQSLEDPALCFITMPILAVDPRYHLTVSGEDLHQLGLPANRQPRIGEDVLALTVVALRESGPTANLLAPVLVNLKNRKALQAVSQEPGYSHQHVIPGARRKRRRYARDVAETGRGDFDRRRHRDFDYPTLGVRA